VISLDRIREVLSHAADASYFDANEDDVRKSSYLDYAMSVIIGRAFSSIKINVRKIEIEKLNFTLSLAYREFVRIFVFATKNAPQNFSICDALFPVTTVQLLKASRKLARSPPERIIN